ncbi:hypothetical protein BDA96_10G307700, partial [Sorghum bicolor]
PPSISLASSPVSSRSRPRAPDSPACLSPPVAALASLGFRPPSPADPPPPAMSKQGGKAKPLKAPKVDKKEYDESDLAYLQKKKDEEKWKEMSLVTCL